MEFSAKHLVSSAAISMLVIFSPQVAAHSAGKANIGYVGDMNGHIEIDGRGKCVRTIHWTPELALPECEPGTAPKPVAAAPKPAPAPAPKPTPVMEKVSLKGGALFDSGKADIKPAGQRELDDLATKLKAYSGVESIQITGHTDNQGRAESNQKLSELRAESVKAYLVSKGVDAGLIKTSGKGETSPVASNETATGRALNRRVEVDITAGKSATP